MRYAGWISALCLVAVTTLAGAGDAPPNLRQVTPEVWVAGQVRPDQLPTLKAQGIVALINLRPVTEHPPLVREAAEAGLFYRELPIHGPQSLTLENVRLLDALLAERSPEPVLIYCASANRVGAMMALRAAWIQGLEPEAALEVGRAHGLRAAEPEVRRRLGLPAAR